MKWREIKQINISKIKRFLFFFFSPCPQEQLNPTFGLLTTCVKEETWLRLSSPVNWAVTATKQKSILKADTLLKHMCNVLRELWENYR